MNKIFTLFTTLALGGVCATASVITPQQALDRALQSTGAHSRVAAANDLQLVQTAKDNLTGEAAVYVFAAADQPGFVIAAANDSYPYALLGYSDSSTYDLTDMPPQFQWWLDTQAKAVAKSDGAQPKTLSVKKASAKEDIPPIVTAKWNQSRPYNNLCPMVNGSRSVTGCVATAMAQVMNVWAWPKQARGGSVTLSGMTINFDESTYNWARMKDSYSGSYTSVEAEAVAKLMVDCGFACDMNYSPNGSGANDLRAALGMIKYFNYDKHLQYLQRDWFSDQEWADLIYNELHEGRPVMISGNDGTVGHCFVCSGFQMQQGVELFHINWGWGGAYDGYFLITDLDPEGTGIGGGSGDAGYNRGNSVVLGIQDPVEGHDFIPTLYLEGVFGTDRTKYTRSADTPIYFPGTYFSVSMSDLNIIVGFKCVAADGTTKYVTVGDVELESLYGFSGLGVEATAFPVGSYDVYPVCTVEGDYAKGVWYPIYTSNTSQGYTHMDVTESTITVTGESPDPTIMTQIVSLSPDSEFYPGGTYTVTMNLKSNVEYTGSLYLILYKGNKLYAESPNGVVVQIPDPTQVYEYAWPITIPSSIELGRYKLALATKNGTTLYLVEGSDNSVDVVDDPSKGVASVSNVLFVGSPSRGTISSRPATIDFGGQIKVGISCTAGTWNESLAGTFIDITNDEPMGETNYVPMTINEGESQTAVLVVNPAESEEMEAGVTYQFVPVAVNRGVITSKNKYYVKFTGELGGVELLNPDRDASAPVEYYNLQGIRLTDPQPGQMVIRRQGSTTSKIKL